METLIWKFIKFGMVGLTGMGVDFGITFLGKEKMGLQKYAANSVGFAIAATTNYFLNRWWTFHSTNASVPVEYAKFFAVSLVGLGINNALLWFAHQKRGQGFYLAKFIAIILTTFWNFAGNLLFTFV